MGNTAVVFAALKSGAIDGAWVPEPWVTRLVNEGGGKVLVNESTLWPKGEFVTTHLVVRTKFLKGGELYAFWVSKEASGASGGYVAAGGPGFTEPTDTGGKGGA